MPRLWAKDHVVAAVDWLRNAESAPPLPPPPPLTTFIAQEAVPKNPTPANEELIGLVVVLPASVTCCKVPTPEANEANEADTLGNPLIFKSPLAVKLPVNITEPLMSKAALGLDFPTPILGSPPDLEINKTSLRSPLPTFKDKLELSDPKVNLTLALVKGEIKLPLILNIN